MAQEGNVQAPQGQAGAVMQKQGQTLAQQFFAGNQYTLKQKLASVGNKYYVYTGLKPTRKQAETAFVHQKIFKLKEDIRIYSNSSMNKEIMRIKQEQILDISGSFQVVDSESNELIGILKRKGLKSMIKDEWIIMDKNRKEIGLIKEKGGIVWILRRFVFTWIPYMYNIQMGGENIANIKEKAVKLADTYYLDINQDPNKKMDRRLAIAALLMMDIGEHE